MTRRWSQSGRSIALVICSLFVLGGGAPGSAAAQTGTVTGRVLQGKEPAIGANVVVLGTMLGDAVDEDGVFTIHNVPVGNRTLRAMVMGAEPIRIVVAVNAGLNQSLTLHLGVSNRAVSSLPTVDVIAKKTDLKSTEWHTYTDRGKMTDLHLGSVQEVIQLVTGVVVQAGVAHIRGGRGDELLTTFDGIPVVDPLFHSAPSIATGAVQGVDVKTGGLDAESGGALSGVVNITTREGGEHLDGDVQWHTDRYGESGKTFDNYDRYTVGVGGPTPIRNLTYFLTYEGVFSDTYLHAGRTQKTASFLDFIRVGNRQANEIDTNAKLAFRPRPSEKLTVEVIRNRSTQTPYNHMWSRQGYVAVTYDTTGAGEDARLTPVYGRWSFYPEDSTYQYENLADHVPTTDTRFSQVKAVWTHSLSAHDVYTARLSRHRFETSSSVGGKKPWEYDVRSPLYWSGNLDDDPFFATHGDFPTYSRQLTTTWTAKADYTTTHWMRHTAKAGIEGVYNEVNLLSMQFPNQEAQGLPGLNRTDFANYNPEGSAFVQDRWEFEGLVLNAGMRYDLFTPGAQIANADLPNGRYKSQWSPRLGIAYPISDRDALSFHYGWTYQTPQRNYVFENRGSQSTVTVRGNPDLSPETNISYQAAVQHLFSNDMSGQFAVFFKDIFGLISVRQEVDALTGLLVPVYVNRDYASARGFETSIVKRFSHRFSGELNYTYSIAAGVASDPRADA